MPRSSHLLSGELHVILGHDRSRAQFMIQVRDFISRPLRLFLVRSSRFHSAGFQSCRLAFRQKKKKRLDYIYVSKRDPHTIVLRSSSISSKSKLDSALSTRNSHVCQKPMSYKIHNFWACCGLDLPSRIIVRRFPSWIYVTYALFSLPLPSSILSYWCISSTTVESPL